MLSKLKDLYDDWSDVILPYVILFAVVSVAVLFMHNVSENTKTYNKQLGQIAKCWQNNELFFDQQVTNDSNCYRGVCYLRGSMSGKEFSVTTTLPCTLMKVNK